MHTPDRFIGCGAQYDPTFWPADTWQEHVVRMVEAGLAFVRLFEFTWAQFEPRDNEHDFGWSDRFLDLLDMGDDQDFFKIIPDEVNGLDQSLPADCVLAAKTLIDHQSLQPRPGPPRQQPPYLPAPPLRAARLPFEQGG